MLRFGLFIFLFSLLWMNNAEASSLVATQNLSFGTLVPINTSGSVIISTAGAINTGGSVTTAPSGTSYYQGIVRFTPTILDIFTFMVSESSVILTNSTSGGGTVNIDNFSINPNSLNITLLSPVNVNIGGRMTFTSASKGGVYTGLVQVKANGLIGGTVSVNLPITLTLWNTLAMSQVTPLSFGSLEVKSGASVIRIAPQSGIRSVVSGSGNVILGSSPSPTAGQFGISGQPNANISISLPSSITLNGSNGGTMTVNNFTGYPSSTTTTLSASGARSLYVGADLNIGAAQASGTYSGTYNVTVNY